MGNPCDSHGLVPDGRLWGVAGTPAESANVAATMMMMMMMFFINLWDYTLGMA